MFQSAYIIAFLYAKSNGFAERFRFLWILHKPLYTIRCGLPNNAKNTVAAHRKVGNRPVKPGACRIPMRGGPAACILPLFKANHFKNRITPLTQ